MTVPPTRHGEARRAVAIQKFGAKSLDRFATLAMTNQQHIAWVHGEARRAVAIHNTLAAQMQHVVNAAGAWLHRAC